MEANKTKLILYFIGENYNFTMYKCLEKNMK